MKKMGFIFFNFDRVEEETGLKRIQKVVGIKTNEELKLISKFEKEVDKENYSKSLNNMFSCFEEWVQNPYENKFVTFEPNDMKTFIEECKNVHYKSKTRDFHKIMSYQYWNVQNEMTYRMGIKKEDISLEELLSVYGLSFVGKKYVAQELCFNTYSFVTHFKLDNKRNKEVFSKLVNGSKRGEHRESKPFPLLDFQPIRPTGEEQLKQKMKEGWNITINCKANGKGYGITYEATAYHIDTPLEERLSSMKFGVGKTLEELIHQLFYSESTQNAVQKRAESQPSDLVIAK